MACGFAERLAGNRTGVLERNGVALLRHDAAPLHKTVGKLQVTELAGAPLEQVLDDTAKSHQHDLRRPTLSSR